MKAVYVKVFAVFMSSLLLFAACKNESDDNSSGVIGTGTVTPSVPATDPVIADGTYFFDRLCHRKVLLFISFYAILLIVRSDRYE